MKRCTKCGELKPETEFKKEKRAKSGITTWCLKCYAAYEREYKRKRYATDPEYKARLNAYSRDYIRKHRPIRTCVICGDPIPERRSKYCAMCSPMAKDCCDYLKHHHDAYKDDPERLSTEFIKNIMHCNCEVKP